MGFSAGLRLALASALVLAPLTQARAQIYGSQSQMVTGELDRIVSADATGWHSNYTYNRWSMRDGSVLQQSNDGRTRLWRGFFRYSDGDRGEVRVRIRDNRVECLVYDTNYTTSWCTLSGGGESWLGPAVVAIIVVGILGSSTRQSQSAPNQSYDSYRQCMQGCANLAIEDVRVYSAARQSCERRC